MHIMYTCTSYVIRKGLLLEILTYPDLYSWCLSSFITDKELSFYASEGAKWESCHFKSVWWYGSEERFK